MKVLLFLLSLLLLSHAQSTCSNNTGGKSRASAMLDMMLKIAQNEGIKGQAVEACFVAGQRPGFFTPANVARAIMGTTHAMYNVWTRFDDVANPTVKTEDVPRLSNGKRTEENINLAITLAAYQMMNYILPETVLKLGYAEKIKQDYGLDVAALAQETDVSTPAGAANTLTARLIEDMKVDGFNQANCYQDDSHYVPVNNPATIPRISGQKAQAEANLAANRSPYHFTQIIVPGVIDSARTYLNPNAANYKTFALNNPFIYLPPPLPSTTAGMDELMQVVANFQESLEDNDGRTKLIAEFWADGPNTTLPPGHWVEITQDVFDRLCTEQDEQIKLLFAVGGAVYDSGIAAWATKRYYNAVRPITYITTFFKDQTFAKAFRGPYCPLGQIEGWQWQPYQADNFVTPPFAEYVSGHSTFSRSSAVVLKTWLGTDVIPGGPFSHTIKAGESLFEYKCSSDGKRNDGSDCTFITCGADSAFNSENSFTPKNDVTLGPWSTFQEMADEAGISRLYGGIHHGQGDTEGRELGRRIGEKVWRVTHKYITGKKSRDNKNLRN